GSGATGSPHVREMARRSRRPDNGALAREPALAVLLRHRPGRDERGSRHAIAAAVTPRTAGLAGGRVAGTGVQGFRSGKSGVRSAGVVAQATASADCHVLDLPAVVPCDG